METFEATTKKWGNSIGIVIPKEIITSEELVPNRRIRLMVLPTEPLGKRLWGVARFATPTSTLFEESESDVQ